MTAPKVIGVLQHGALAAALLVALSALFEPTTASGERPTRWAEAPLRSRMAEERKPAPRPQTEDACLSCGQRIPPDAAKCPACGWTWDSEPAVRG